MCELLGGLGLILPWALKIRRELTPIAAACLLIIMGGAVVTTVLTMSVVAALFPLTTGVLLATLGIRSLAAGARRAGLRLQASGLRAGLATCPPLTITQLGTPGLREQASDLEAGQRCRPGRAREFLMPHARRLIPCPALRPEACGLEA